MSPADLADKKRVIVRPERKQFALLVGCYADVHIGSLEECLALKRAFLETHKYVDESPKAYQDPLYGCEG